MTKYKCDNCKEAFDEGDEIIAVNNNVGGLSLMEDTLSKKWVILCNDCYHEMKAELVEQEDWMDLDLMGTDIKYFWHIGELQELLKEEDKEIEKNKKPKKRCVKTKEEGKK